MMSGHGANPIFFNNKIKIGRPEHSLTPHPLPVSPITWEMKNGQWTTNGFQEEKWAIGKFIEKIVKSSGAVVGYLTVALCIICWDVL